MSIAPLPTPLQHLGGRRFSFYPPIRNLEHNEWLYRRATWSEFVVASTRTGKELFIPRNFLGDVSHEDEPVMVVRLMRELEFRHGSVTPREQRVIELPVAVQDSVAAAHSGRLAPVINIRLEGAKPESRAWKWMGVAAVLGAVALTIVSDVARHAQSNQRGDSLRGVRSYLQLTGADDYPAILRKLGAPASQKTGSTPGGIYRTLNYPARHYSVVMLGVDAASARYIGTVDQYGRVLHSVSSHEAAAGQNTGQSSLRSVPSF